MSLPEGQLGEVEGHRRWLDVLSGKLLGQYPHGQDYMLILLLWDAIRGMFHKKGLIWKRGLPCRTSLRSVINQITFALGVHNLVESFLVLQGKPERPFEENMAFTSTISALFVTFGISNPFPHFKPQEPHIVECGAFDFYVSCLACLTFPI